MHSARGFADKQYTSILYTILQIIAKKYSAGSPNITFTQACRADQSQTSEL